MASRVRKIAYVGDSDGYSAGALRARDIWMNGGSDGERVEATGRYGNYGVETHE